MNIKENDEIYAYELLKLSGDIEREYRTIFGQIVNKEKESPENFKIGEFVDIKDKKGDWVYGKILDTKN